MLMLALAVFSISGCAGYRGLPERELLRVERQLIDCASQHFRTNGYSVVVTTSRARWLRPPLQFAPPELRLVNLYNNTRMSIFILPNSAHPDGFTYETATSWSATMRSRVLLDLDARCNPVRSSAS